MELMCKKIHYMLQSTDNLVNQNHQNPEAKEWMHFPVALSVSPTSGCLSVSIPGYIWAQID